LRGKRTQSSQHRALITVDSEIGDPCLAEHLYRYPPEGQGVRVLTEPEKAWLAAAIDGEDSIGIYQSSDGRRAQVRVCNTDVRFVERAKEIVGCGSISYSRVHKGEGHKGHKPVHDYSLKGSLRNLRLLQQIEPYLIIKRDKALAIIEEITTKPFGRWKNATPEARAFQSRRLKEEWQDPVLRQRRLDGMRAAALRKRGGDAQCPVL